MCVQIRRMANVKKLFFVIFAISATAISEDFQKCELAYELSFKYKLSTADVPLFACLADRASKFRLAQRNNFYGLWRLGAQWWCAGAGTAGSNFCNMRCDKLLNDDLEDDLQCLNIIRARTGLASAFSFYEKCYGIVGSYADECFVTDEIRRNLNAEPNIT